MYIHVAPAVSIHLVDIHHLQTIAPTCFARSESCYYVTLARHPPTFIDVMCILRAIAIVRQQHAPNVFS